MGSSVHGSAGSDRTLLQYWFPQVTGGHLLCCGPSWSMLLPQHGLHHRLQEDLTSSAWSTSSLSFTGLGDCRTIPLTYCHSSLQPLQIGLAFFPPSIICYPRCFTVTSDGLGLGQWQLCLGAGWRMQKQMKTK